MKDELIHKYHPMGPWPQTACGAEGDGTTLWRNVDCPACLAVQRNVQSRQRVVAHVGAFRKTSRADAARWLAAEHWLARNGHPVDDLEHDVVNLRYGRDFLAENKRYAYVVLHGPVNPDVAVVARRRNKPEGYRQTATSPLHSRKAWRDRLSATRAQVIFLLEDRVSVGVKELGPLRGYRIVEGEIPQASMYVRMKKREGKA